MTYALRHYLKQFNRQDLATYPRTLLSWPGIHGDIALMDDTLRRWSANPALSLVDAYLVALAQRDAVAVSTKNVRHFVGHGVSVPDPLPDGTTP